MSSKELFAIDHIFMSSKQLIKTLEELRAERKAVLGKIRIKATKLKREKINIADIDMLFDIIEACPSVNNATLLKACKDELDQMDLENDKMNDSDVSAMVFSKLIYSCLESYNSVNVSYYEEMREHMQILFRLLADAKIVLTADEPDDKKEEPKDKKSSKKGKTKVSL